MIWHPRITFLNALSVEKNQGVGYENLHEYFARPNNELFMVETIKIIFSCEFKFATFPFDKHDCNLTYYDRIYDVNYVNLNQAWKVEYVTEDLFTYIEKEGSLHLNVPKIPFDIWVKINPKSSIIDGTISTAGIKLKLQRDSIGLLMGSFYVPTGVFAVLSMASFVINPDVVSYIINE